MTPSQNDRVLARLRQGPVATVDFQPPDVCDGGKPIWRVAARIGNLRDRGYAITSRLRPDGTAEYRLLGGDVEAQRQVDAEALAIHADLAEASFSTFPESSEPPGLFDPVGFTERGDFRDEAA